MHFTDLFIRRPVLAIVVSLLLLLLGLKAFTSLQLRQYPEIVYPVINVTTVYPGASAELVKGFVTTPLLNAVSNAEGIDYATATSVESRSTIQIYLTPGYDVNAAFLEIGAKVSKVRGELPEAAEEPLVEKMEGLGADTLQYLSFSSAIMNEEQITDFLTKVIMPAIATVDGMGRAELQGKRPFAMRVWLNPEKMAAYGVTASDINSALRNNNFQSTAGKIEGRNTILNVSAQTSLTTTEEFRAIVVRASADSLVRLGDVARVELGAESYNEIVRFDGKRTVFIKTAASVNANPLDVAQGVRDMLPDLRKQLPPGLDVDLVFDTTRAIESSIREVVKTLIEASVIVIIVIFLFLGSLRSVVIPVVTIPLSLIGVLFAMLLLGFSVNLLTLLAMVLAIGLVVDDAIVVVENIQRHIEEGAPPMQAALDGAREIAFPVIAMTITLAAVYGPIGFLEGLTGALFAEFAFTLAGAVIISGIIALTLSPMMCSYLLSSDVIDHGLVRWLDARFDSLRFSYKNRLEWLLHRRRLGLVFAAVILLTVPFLYSIATHELAPNEDDGAVHIGGAGPLSASMDYMERYAVQAEQIINAVPERDRSFIWIQGNSFFSLLMLDDWAERERSSQQVQDALQAAVANVSGLELYGFNFPSLPGTSPGLPMQLVLTTTASEALIYQVGEKVVDDLRNSGLFTYVTQSLKFDRPQLIVTIDRDKAGEMGVSMRDIGDTLSLLLGEADVGRFSMEDHSYKVIPQAERLSRFNPEDLANYYVRSDTGAMIALDTLVAMEVRAAPNKLSQFQQLNATHIGAMLAPGVTMGEAVNYLEDATARLLPEGFSHDYTGQARQFLEEGGTLAMTFLFSFILIYLVLAAQFESFRDPLIILISVPMSVCGALIPLALGVATMNIYTQIGLVTLIGLISKHGILIVDFANKAQLRGATPFEAVSEAAAVRLRPILMTTAAMVFGVTPLLFATGAGAASRFDIGLVITAGMTVGTLFTLFVVPTLYLYIARRHVAQPA